MYSCTYVYIHIYASAFAQENLRTTYKTHMHAHTLSSRVHMRTLHVHTCTFSHETTNILYTHTNALHILTYQHAYTHFVDNFALHGRGTHSAACAHIHTYIYLNARCVNRRWHLNMHTFSYKWSQIASCIDTHVHTYIHIGTRQKNLRVFAGTACLFICFFEHMLASCLVCMIGDTNQHQHEFNSICRRVVMMLVSTSEKTDACTLHHESTSINSAPDTPRAAFGHFFLTSSCRSHR